MEKERQKDLNKEGGGGRKIAKKRAQVEIKRREYKRKRDVCNTPYLKIYIDIYQGCQWKIFPTPELSPEEY